MSMTPLTIELGSPDFWKGLHQSPAEVARVVCDIDLADLTETLRRHPSLVAWINAEHERTRIAEEKLKWTLTQERARLRIALMEDGKKRTVAETDAVLDASPTVGTLMAALHSHAEQRGALRAISDALRDRSDMLVQLSVKQREESRHFS